MSAPTDELPSDLRAALAAPGPERRAWRQALVVPFLTAFLWVAYFDQLPRFTLLVGGLGWSLAGAVVAGMLCHVLLFLPPALWGVRTGLPFAVLATSTFGAAGAAWLPGGLLRLAQVAWFAVAIAYATDLTFDGLVVCGLVDARALDPLILGGLTLRGPVVLFTALVWCGLIALAGYYLTRIVHELIRVYLPALAAVLAAVVLWTLPGLTAWPTGGSGLAGSPGWAGPLAALAMIQLVFGFFATASASAADWGAACRDERDVGRGGWIAVAVPAAVCATMSLLVVAGANGRVGAASSGSAVVSTFTEAVVRTIPWPLACLTLLGFGAASLAPGSFAAFAFSRRTTAEWPGVWPRRRVWLIVLGAWPLIATGWAHRLDLIFGVVGTLVAPVLGALTGDFLRHRGAWPGPRPGIRRAGWAAWAVGVVLGLGAMFLAPTIGGSWPGGGRLLPTAPLAYAAALAAFLALSREGRAPAEVAGRGAVDP